MAGFYTNYQTSASEKPPGRHLDDELAPGFGTPQAIPQFLPPTTTSPKPTTQGAPSPASQIQKTGNTGMNSPGPQTTTGTPSSATGSGLPPYGSNWAFNWQTGNTSMGVGAPVPAQITPYEQVQGPNWAAYDPNNAGGATAAKTALQSLLSGDASGMDTSALKNRLKEQRLQMEGDQRASSRQAAAGRGMLDSGWQAADERRIGSSARKDILGGFRDVDIAAAELGARNKIAASSALDAVLSGETSRASTGFANALEGSKFTDQQKQFATSSDLDKGRLDLDTWATGADSAIKTRDQDIEVAKGKTNELIGRLGLAVNLDEIAAGSSRDKMQFLTDIFKILTQQEQFNAQMGFNYNQLGMDMNEILASVAKSIGA